MGRNETPVRYTSTEGSVPLFVEPKPGKRVEPEEGVLHLKSEAESRVLIFLASVNLLPVPRY